MKNKIIQISLLLFFGTFGFAQKGQLTGNWGGTRDSLKEKGLYIEPRVTLFQHNYLSGSASDESVVSGKADLAVKWNAKEIGLSKWTLVTHLEQNFGQNINSRGGVLVPSNAAATFPGTSGSDRFDITSLHLVYQFGKANALMLGKINMVDIASETRYTGGAGIDAFWNVNFAAPVSGIMPPYIFGAVSVIKTPNLKYTFIVYDPRSYANNFPTPFEKGISFNAGIEKEWSILGKKGTHAINARFSTQDGLDLYTLGDIILPNSGNAVSNKSNRWYVSYVVNQNLVEYSEKGKGWGLFWQIGISDGNPNPIKFGSHVGIGGNSFIKNRSNDKWGIAYYNYGLSKPVEDVSLSLGTKLHNEQGLEMFYQAWLTPYFSLGTNVQWVDPVVADNKNSFLLGFRSSLRF